MTGQIVATARWRALDRSGEESCRLFRADGGWLLMGHARFRDDLGFAALDYVVRCGRDWITQSADVTGQHGDHKVQARIFHDQGRWWLGEQEQEDVRGATDLDLSFTPATNTMPLRRLMQSGQMTLSVTAAWMRYPQARLFRLNQSYGRSATPDMFTYSGAQTGFETELTVHSSGFVSHYPDLWTGEITPEPHDAD